VWVAIRKPPRVYLSRITQKHTHYEPQFIGTGGESNYSQYKKDGNEQLVPDNLQIVKNWSNKYGVPVLCSEYGVL
jgi:endoglucanase